MNNIDKSLTSLDHKSRKHLKMETSDQINYEHQKRWFLSNFGDAFIYVLTENAVVDRFE